MLRRFLNPTRKLIAAIIGAVVFIVLVFLVISKSTELPKEFIDARGKAADTSKTIVELTTQTAGIIERANVFDSGGDSEKVLTLISTARSNNNQAYEKASLLAQQLKELAESLDTIPSKKSKQLAYESVAVELSLVSEFIVYTNRLNAFLDTLARAVATDFFSARREVYDRLREVNAQARKINAINQEFLKRIGDFDASIL